jgi:transposase
LAIGRKNHYGSKSLRGTKVAAVMYSLIETCKLLGVSSEQYLTTLAQQALESDAEVALLPHEFKAELAAHD